MTFALITLFFLAFHAAVLGAFLWALTKINGEPLEFGYGRDDTEERGS